MTEEKDFEVKIKMSLLKRIAEYYEFPLAVFFSDSKIFPKKKTRNKVLAEAYEKLKKIKEIIQDEE